MTATPGFSGIHAVLYAFFDADERLDRAAMRRQVETMLAAGVDGIVVNGLATEVAKLSEAEKRTTVAWAAEDIARRVPLGVTVTGGSVAAQTELLRHAEATGAQWVILQPPAVGSYAAAEYIRFFGRVAAGTSLPVAIQNAPAYLGRGLAAADIAELTRLYPNIRLLKGEGPAVEIERLIATTEGRLPVFNGRGGLELIDNLRAGCAGFILAPDLIDVALAACRAYRSGDEAGAEEAYRRMLPAACFVMQSLETLIGYGKRLFAARAGLTVHDRAPALGPTEFGLARVAAYAAALGPLRKG